MAQLSVDLRRFWRPLASQRTGSARPGGPKGEGLPFGPRILECVLVLFVERDLFWGWFQRATKKETSRILRQTYAAASCKEQAPSGMAGGHKPYVNGSQLR